MKRDINGQKIQNNHKVSPEVEINSEGYKFSQSAQLSFLHWHLLFLIFHLQEEQNFVQKKYIVMDYATMQPRGGRDPNVILKIPFDKSISLCDD